MARYLETTDMSELEREFELEMEDEPAHESSLEAAFESTDDHETQPEGEESLQQLEAEPDSESADYADRFFELSQREFESDGERDAALHEVMRDMERDYFLGGLIKAGSGLLKRAKQFTKGAAFKQLTSWAKQIAGPLSGNLGALASAALSAYPGGAALLPILKTLGFDAASEEKAPENPEANKEAWNNFVSFAREAYGHMAENAGEREARDPAAAMQLASRSMAAATAAARRGLMGSGAFARPAWRGTGFVGRRGVYHVRVPRRVLARGMVIRIDVV